MSTPPPTPLPAAVPTPPLGAPRPPLNTMDEANRLREAAEFLSTSQELRADAAPDSADSSTWEGRFRRQERQNEMLQEQNARLIGAMSDLMRSNAHQLELQRAQNTEQRQNTDLTRRGRLAALWSAYGIAFIGLFTALSKAFAEFGVQNPGAPLTATTVLLIVARAVSGLDAKAKARAAADAPDGPPAGGS